MGRDESSSMILRGKRQSCREAPRLTPGFGVFESMGKRREECRGEKHQTRAAYL